MKVLSTLLFVSICCVQSTAQKPVRVTSPNGKIVFNFRLQQKTAQYAVSYNGTELISYSTLGLVFDDGTFGNNLKMYKPVYKDTVEEYSLVVGKTKNVREHYKAVIIPLEETTTPFRKINLEVKLFDDGVAFRYNLPLQQNSSFTLLDENTTFKLTGDPITKALILPNYTSSQEGFYTTLPLSKIATDTLIAMPTLFQFPNKIYMAITEAALLDYAGMYLSKHDGVLVSKLSPLPKQASIKVKAKLPHSSPWRVMLISNNVGDLQQNNIITTLNEPCKIKDLSWIKPGKSTFPWWNGNVTPDTLNAPGNNFVTAQYYIDFCARNNIEYHSVVEYGLHQWYTDDGVGFMPGPHSDPTTPVPGLDMKEICDYAATKGVGVRVWVHWWALYPKLDSAFAIFERWGLKGMMVDFMDRDDQEMVNIQTEILEKAAKHHLHIQFHGAYKPTGLSRTYPNEFTREGTLNYEIDKWDAKGLPPDHDLDIAFTRLLAGSTDYHLGGFRAVPQSKFKTQYTRPLMLGTRCHMLGMYVVLENAVQMVCDYPAAYEGEPGFEFIQAVPTAWDETKTVTASVDEYIITARRKNNDWFIGGINNHDARNVNISFSFLPEGNYTATIFTDAVNAAEQPNKLQKQTRTITAKDTMQIQMAAGGGIAIILKKQ